MKTEEQSFATPADEIHWLLSPLISVLHGILALRTKSLGHLESSDGNPREQTQEYLLGFGTVGVVHYNSARETTSRSLLWEGEMFSFYRSKNQKPSTSQLLSLSSTSRLATSLSLPVISSIFSIIHFYEP